MKNSQSIPVYVVLMEASRVIRVTHDPEDAERYRRVYAESPSGWQDVRILKRTVSL